MADLFHNTIKTDKPFDRQKVLDALEEYKQEIVGISFRSDNEIYFMSEDPVVYTAKDVSKTIPDATVNYEAVSEFDDCKVTAAYEDGTLMDYVLSDYSTKEDCDEPDIERN